MHAVTPAPMSPPFSDDQISLLAEALDKSIVPPIIHMGF